MFNPKLISNAKADVIFVYLAYSLRYLYLLLLIPFYARVLGAQGYGVVLAALSLMQMIWLFVSWGFATAGTREISIAKSHDYANIFSIHFSARVILSVVAFIIGLIAIYFSGVLSQHPLAGVIAVILGIVSAYNLGWYFSGTGRPRQAVKLEVLGFILNLALILSLVKGENDTWLTVASILVSGSVALAIAHWWIQHEIKPLRLNFKQGLALISSTKTFFIYSSASLVLGASSTYLLSILSTSAQVGYFGSAERLVSAGLSLMGPLGAVFIPKVTVLFNSNKELAYRYVRKLLLFLLTIAITGLLVSFFGAKPIIHLVFGGQFDGSVHILKCLAFIFPFSAVSLVLSAYVLIPLHQEKKLAKIAVISALFNIAIAIPLAIIYGGFGMAIARLSSEIFTFILLLCSCYKLEILAQLFKFKKHQGELV